MDPWNNPGPIQVAGDDGFGNYQQPGYPAFGAVEFGAEEQYGAEVADLMAGVEFGAPFPFRPQMRPQARPQARPANPLAAVMAQIAQMQRQIAQLAQGNSVARLPFGGVVVDTGPTKDRELPVGVDSGATLILAGASQDIQIQPQVDFRVERLIAANSLAPNFSIRDVKVGKDSQLVASGEIPAETFSNLSVGVGLKGDVCRVGQIITVSVVNTSGAPARFRGSLIGKARY